MQARHEWATSIFWPEPLLSRSESGSWSWGCWAPDELHHAAQQAGEWIGWNNQLRPSRSTNENALELEDAALKLSDTNKLPKQGNQQCNNLNHTLTDKNQDTGLDSLVGLLRMVVKLMFVQVGFNLSMPQAWRKARYSFHRLVVDSSAAFTSDLTLPFSIHSSTSCRDHIGVLVCTTGTDAWWGELASFSLLSSWNSNTSTHL